MRIGSGFAAVLDQVWLSVLNLAISLAFIRLGTKEDYGVYLLLLTPLSLIQGIQNALILSPVATVLPNASPEDQATVVATVTAALVFFVVTAGVVGGLALAAFGSVTQGGFSAALCVSFAAAVAGVCSREGARTLFYVRGNAPAALSSDLVYGIVLLAIVGIVCSFNKLDAASVLAAMAVAALWQYIFKFNKLVSLQLNAEVVGKLWECGRWALVGVVVTWVNLSAYPLIVGMKLDTSAVADINVARLFLMPVALGITAWSNLYRPKLTFWMTSGKAADMRQLSVRSVWFGWIVLLVVAVALAALYPILEPLLGTSYRGLLPLVLLWTLYFAVNLARSILMATLMTKPSGYRLLQKVSWVALAVSLSGLFWLSSLGAVWVVAVLIAVEFFQLGLIGMTATRWWARGADDAA